MAKREECNGKKVINKTYEWVTWQWANTKINKESLALLK
jgi:hypothetical protein